MNHALPLIRARKASRSPAVRYFRAPSAVCSPMPICGAGEGDLCFAVSAPLRPASWWVREGTGVRGRIFGFAVVTVSLGRRDGIGLVVTSVPKVPI